MECNELCLKNGYMKEHIPDYKYTPVTVLANDTSKIYSYRDLLTDSTIQHSRPDIGVLDKKDKTLTLPFQHLTILGKKTWKK